ncbi:MAG: NADH-quinone oxidoreductase subunit NuoK [bacterium]
MITITHYTILSALLFSIGIYGVITRKNAIGILISIELIFNAVNINMVAVSRYLPQTEIYGQVFAVFIIAVAAAESVIGLAIILAIYNSRKKVNADEMDIMKF